jgi:hypothetical protein
MKGAPLVGFFAAVAVAAATALVAVDAEANQVCLNKLSPLPRLADLAPFPPAPPPLHCLRDLFLTDPSPPLIPSAPPTTKQPLPLQIQAPQIKRFVDRRVFDDSAIIRDLTSSSIYYLRRRRSTNPSVVRNELLHWL